MQGTVKWFSEEKGYGFIVAEDGTEHYFHVRSVKGAILPKNGATVDFRSVQGKKGLAADQVMIVAQPAGHRDDRIECRHCHKTMVPRIITQHGHLSHSVCPFCGGTVKQFDEWWLWLLIGPVLMIVLLVWFAVGGHVG